MSETGGTGNDITYSHNRAITDLGYATEVIENGIDRASCLLADFNHSVINRAIGSAVKRGLAAGKTAAKKAIAQEYTITQKDFLHKTKNLNHLVHNSDGSMAWVVAYAGYVIPLITFKTRQGRDGRLTTQVKRSNSAEVLRHAFKAKIYGHEGIFE